MSSVTPDSISEKNTKLPEEVTPEVGSQSNSTHLNKEDQIEQIIEDKEQEQEHEDEVIRDANSSGSGDILLSDVSDSKNEEIEEKHELTDLENALNLRDKVDALIRRTFQTKVKCDKLDHDNKYLQDYVGNLMNSGELLTKRF